MARAARRIHKAGLQCIKCYAQHGMVKWPRAALALQRINNGTAAVRVPIFTVLLACSHTCT
jgi:hypothetical protein